MALFPTPTPVGAGQILPPPPLGVVVDTFGMPVIKQELDFGIGPSPTTMAFYPPIRTMTPLQNARLAAVPEDRPLGS